MTEDAPYLDVYPDSRGERELDAPLCTSLPHIPAC